MAKLLNPKKDQDKAIIRILICCVGIVIGYYVLNHIATLEDPPLGNTIYMLIGLTLIAVGILLIFMILKKLYDKKVQKKRRALKHRKHKVVFLKKETTKNKNNS
jgi:uncharacterized membrane protein